MRNLEQLEEQQIHDDGPMRRAGVFVLAAATTLALVYGVGALMGQRPEETPVVDPLDALLASAPLHDSAQASAEELAELAPVDRESLEFPAALAGEDRPEVEAAIAAAASEYGRLGGSPPVAPIATLPAASIALGTAVALIDTARHDPMVAAALPAVDPPAEDSETAEAGEDGEYTLQVASFRLEEEANLFARALRERGHDTFVMRAEIEGRGVFHRVRVGPFESAGAARRYRRTFEQEERMDTYVVRNRSLS